MENRVKELEEKVKWLTDAVAKLQQAHVSSSAHEDSFYEDEDDDRWFDELTPEEKQAYLEDEREEALEREIEEKLSDCHCGAYQLSKKGTLIKVADCCC